MWFSGRGRRQGSCGQYARRVWSCWRLSPFRRNSEDVGDTVTGVLREPIVTSLFILRILCYRQTNHQITRATDQYHNIDTHALIYKYILPVPTSKCQKENENGKHSRALLRTSKMNTLAFLENTDYGVVTNSFGRKCLSRMEVANRDSLYVNTEPPTYCSSTFMLSSTVHRSPLAITKRFYNSAAYIKKIRSNI